jgi:hypothetical protein
MKWSRVFLWFALLNWSFCLVEADAYGTTHDLHDLAMALLSLVAVVVCFYIRHKELDNEDAADRARHSKAGETTNP